MTGPERYPAETLDEDSDNGTMPENITALAEAVIGHRIVSVEEGVTITRKYEWSDRTYQETATVITLDSGEKVALANTGDCCAFTELEAFLLHPELVDHIITGVGTTGGYTVWHIYADAGDVLELSVGWSPGNPFYYGYGFSISVEPAP